MKYLEVKFRGVSRKFTAAYNDNDATILQDMARISNVNPGSSCRVCSSAEELLDNNAVQFPSKIKANCPQTGL